MLTVQVILTVILLSVYHPAFTPSSDNASGGSVGVPAAFNNCSGSGCSRKAMSELGHNDCQQLTTGNSLPPNNPPPSSVSVPHTPAGTLRRGHRNLQLLRPQVRYHSDVVPILKYS